MNVKCKVCGAERMPKGLTACSECVRVFLSGEPHMSIQALKDECAEIAEWGVEIPVVGRALAPFPADRLVLVLRFKHEMMPDMWERSVTITPERIGSAPSLAHLFSTCVRRAVQEWTSHRDKFLADRLTAYNRRVTPDAAPDFTEYVVGFREWKLGPQYELLPLGVSYGEWAGGAWVHGTCRNGSKHRVPHPGCECGLYARHSVSGVHSGRQDAVAGVVRARGLLEVHHEGFRAEFAQPIALFADTTRATRAAAFHGLPLVPRDKAYSFAARHGRVLPPKERPTSNWEEYRAADWA